MRPEIRLREEHKIDGEKDRVKVEAVHRRKGRLDGMRRKADETNLARLPRRDESFQRPAGTERLVEVFHLGQGMKLVKVEMVRPQKLQRLIEFRRRARLVALQGLTGEKGLLAVRLQGRAEALLGVAVAGGYVEVIDAAVKRLRDEIVGETLLRVHHPDPSEGDDGKIDSGLPQSPLRHRRKLGRHRRRLREWFENFARGCESRSRCALRQQISSTHLTLLPLLP